MGPLPVAPNAITFTNVATEFGLTINTPARGLGANFRFAAGTYTPASPAIPTGSTSSIALSANLGGKTYTPPAPLYAFDNFLFTSSNVTGPTGPTLAQFTTGIPATPGGLGQPYYTLNMYTNVTTQAFYPNYWSLYLSRPGYQQWTVPETSVYSVIACGGCGGVHAQGTIGTNTTANFGGSGYAAVVAGPFNFTRSQNLIITIGQQGGSTFGNVIPTTTAYQGKGGGGATTIVDAANTSIPILVAAGGGGQTISSRTPTGYQGGRGGRALSFITATGSTSAAGTDAQPGSAAYGAGFAANGAGTTAAQSWANGSSGGTNADTLPGAGFISPGGFGGGGPGGLQPNIQSKGGGGGGWIGGNGSAGEYGVSTSQQQSGGRGGVSYCLATTSPSAGASPIYLGYTNQKTTSELNLGMPQVFCGCCWIKKMTPRSTLLPAITFTDCRAYRYTQPGPPTLADRTALLTDANLTATLCPYWFGHCQGYHAWCVPKTGVYEITAAGGGGDWALSAANRGGRGRIITARYSLSLGDILIITVGHRGYLPTTPTGIGAGGGCTTVHLNGMTASWNGTSGNLISTATPGYPLLCASGGNGGAAVAIGADASASDVTGAVTSAQFGGQVGTTNNNISSGACLYAETSGRTGTWHRTSIPNGWGFVDHYIGLPFAAGGGGGGWGGGGRGATTVNLTGGGAGWVAGGGSNNGTGGPSRSYYWSGTYYVAGSYSAGYNAIAPSNPGSTDSTGSGYVTITGIS